MSLINKEDLMLTLGITDMDCEKCGWYSRAARMCKRGSDFEEVCCAIENAPTIESEQQWIPVTERLPEKNGRYLVTRGLNAVGAIWNRVYIVNYSDLMGLKDSRIFWQGNVGKSDFEKLELEDVLAWMPLPEPYKEMREE